MREFAARYDAPGSSIYAPALLRDLSALEPDAVVCSDVGQHQLWVAQHWAVAHPRNHLSSAGLGPMGFGLPAAIGAQMADPDARVIFVSGDGGFQLHILELATMALERLPVDTVLIDKQAPGIGRQWEELRY